MSESASESTSFWGVLLAIVKNVINQGSFNSGLTFGVGVTLFVHWIATRGINRENTRRMELEFEREKELRDQLDLKDQRISSLHDEIYKLSKGMKL